MTTYEKHFGLSKRVYAAHATGTDVFVAPQVATAMAGLQKALKTEDAIVSLSGPVGSGKTTIAKRACDNVGENRGVVTIGRMQFGHDEVLELLLAGLGARQLPKSTVHRFATFRRLLQQFAEQKIRVIILVEDAVQIGFDALSELEALTAADAGVSNGANLVLLGDDRLNDLLRDPKMARVKQRLRSRQIIAAQSHGELLGYLKHSFRLADGEFDTIFEAGCSDALHRLSDGLPRVVNNLVEAVLATAAEQGKTKIDAALIHQVAADEFGLTGEHNVADIEAAIEQAEALEEAQAPEPTLEPISVEITAPRPEPEPEPQPEPKPEVAAVEEDEEDEIPELIQDTLPDLQILAPDLAAGVVDPEPVHEPTENELPVLSGSMRLDLPLAKAAEEPAEEPAQEPESPVAVDIPAEARDENGEVPTEIPEWDRDPTLAELRPDLEALERAMAFAHGAEPDSSVEADALQQAAPELPELKPEPVAEMPSTVPEITLDKQIEEKIQEATEALKQADADTEADLVADGDASNDDSGSSEAVAKEVPPAATPRPLDNIDIPPKPNDKSEKADRELEKITSGLANAKTLEDVDDHLAETLFGEEFSMIAAQVAANAPMQKESEVAAGTRPGETIETPALSLEETAEIEVAASKPQPESMDTSASQRLQVLRDINKTPPPRGAPPSPDTSESIVLSESGPYQSPAKSQVGVDTIEEQITTSMTQTLKALNIKPNPKSDSDNDDDEDEDDEDTKKGFFSRFRKK